MSSKYLTILLAVAALLLTTSCSNEDMDALLADSPVSAQVTASINDGKTVTRISDTPAFTEGDEIHVVAIESTTADDGTTSYAYSSYEYTLQSDGTWSSTSPYYFPNSNSVSFLGWYADPNVAVPENTVPIDTSVQTIDSDTGWNQWDILATSSAVSTTESSPTVSFTGDNAFKHIMSKMTFTFTAGDGFDDLTDVTGYAVKYVITDATFYPLYYNWLSTGSTTGNISMNITGTTDETTSITCDPIILVPQELTNGKFTLEATLSTGKGYSVDLTLPTATDGSTVTALAAGTHYTYTVSINKTGLKVESAAINDWNTPDTQTGDASIKGYTVTDNEDGTKTYTVYNQKGLEAWADYVLEGNYSTNCTLGANITLTEPDTGESNWTPVGASTSTKRYTGTIEGNGMTITGLTISATSSYQGLIGYLGSNGKVNNLTLEDVNISSTGISSLYIAGVVGYNNGGTITNCSVSGTVEGKQNTAGVVGFNNSGTVTNCYSSATVSGTNCSGGVVGRNNGTVTNCYSSGNVEGAQYVGGVMGFNYTSGAITNCYSSGNVTGSSDVGGVVGINYNTITACYATGEVSGTGYYLGGAVGNNAGTVTACYYSSTDYGIGDSENSGTTDSEDVTTKVDGSTVTWASAATAMNTALSGSGWQYSDYTNDDPPLLLVVEGTSTE